MKINVVKATAYGGVLDQNTYALENGDEVVSTDAEYTFAVTGDVTLTAEFQAEENKTLTLAVNDPAMGNIALPEGIVLAENSVAYGPFQAHIASGKYPYYRSIYMINAESSNGLCTGFTIFVAGQRGQKIFEKSNVSPARIEERVINLKDEF